MAPAITWGEYSRQVVEARTELARQRVTPGRYLAVRPGQPFNLPMLVKLAKTVTASNRNVLFPLVLDQLYSCLIWRGRVSITVYTNEANGKGDLMLGVKAAQMLRGAFPEAPSADLTLIAASEAIAKETAVFESSGLTYAAIPGDKNNPPATAIASGGITGPEQLLVAPQLAATRNIQREAPARWGCELFAITEYSKQEDAPEVFGRATGTTQATGLGMNELGITFDQRMREYKRAQDGLADGGSQRKARLAELRNVSPRSAHLLRAVVGDSERLPFARRLNGFMNNERSRLYFSYSNKSAARFALIVAGIEKDTDEDVALIQICPEGWNPRVQLNCTWLKTQLATDAGWQTRLADLGIGQIDFIEFPHKETTELDKANNVRTHGTTSRIVLQSSSARTMSWVFSAQGVPHPDMLTLMRASEPVVMTTGNQSTSEAFSAGKTIFYESIGMEQSLAFLRSLYEGAAIPPLHWHAIRTISRDFEKGVRNPVPGPADFEYAARALRFIRTSGNLARFSDVAVVNKDLGRWIGGHYIRKMLHACPTVAPHLLRMEADLTNRVYNDPGSYRLLLQHLFFLAGSRF
ncbi:MAG TPA: hypothetical protein VGH20_03720 [Myxococcales bacterium]